MTREVLPAYDDVHYREVILSLEVEKHGSSVVLTSLVDTHSVVLCYLSNTSMEAAGWNDCKPVHRAVAEGHTHILQILLRNGADVNSLDMMR